MNSRWLGMGALIYCQWVSAEQAIPQKPTDPLEEGDVNAQHEALSAIRAEMARAEEHFYDEYNKVNTDHQYDIVCRIETPTGTRLSSRICLPEFVNMAKLEEARGFLHGHLVAKDTQVILQKQSAYKKNFLDVISKHPELRKLAFRGKTFVSD